MVYYTNRIFLQIHMFRFASYGTHAMNYFASVFGDFYASGTQDVEITKSLIFSVVFDTVLHAVCSPRNATASSKLSSSSNISRRFDA